MRVLTRRPVLAWALYDWGNSAFATTVLAGFFPVFFKQYWATGMSPTESTWWLGLATAGGSLAVAVTAPLAGTLRYGLVRCCSNGFAPPVPPSGAAGERPRTGGRPTSPEPAPPIGRRRPRMPDILGSFRT